MRLQWKLQSDIVGGSYIQNKRCLNLNLIDVDTYNLFFDYIDNSVGSISILA